MGEGGRMQFPYTSRKPALKSNTVHLTTMHKKRLVISKAPACRGPRVYPNASEGKSEGPCVPPLTQKVPQSPN